MWISTAMLLKSYYFKYAIYYLQSYIFFNLQTNTFTIETKGAGRGGLGLAIVGPTEPKMTCRDNRDGSCTVEYVPLEVGSHEIDVKFNDQHVPGNFLIEF